jgi:hypothetical protein
MRALLATVLTLALVAPLGAAAEGEHAASRATARARSHPRAAAPGAHPAQPAPPRGQPGVPRPVPVFLPRYVYDPFFYAFAPAWWGWGWGWGYYPLYPRPGYGYAPEQVHRIVTRLDVFGGGTLKRGGGDVGMAVAVEGERLGFDLRFDGFYRGRGLLGPSTFFAQSSTYGQGSAHLSFALVATDVARVRAELGGSFLAWPDRGPDAGLAVGGPDVGLSAEIGLVGPLALEGRAFLMPLPVPVSDVTAGIALRFGPAAITAGWRELAVYKSDNNAARFTFAGPQAGIALQF